MPCEPGTRNTTTTTATTTTTTTNNNQQQPQQPQQPHKKINPRQSTAHSIEHSLHALSRPQPTPGQGQTGDASNHQRFHGRVLRVGVTTCCLPPRGTSLPPGDQKGGQAHHQMVEFVGFRGEGKVVQGQRCQLTHLRLQHPQRGHQGSVVESFVQKQPTAQG